MRHRKPAFFSLPALLALAGLLLVTLYLLFPRQAAFEDPRYLEAPDSISLAYLETLLKSDSGNQKLRLNLSRMQQKAGQPNKAMNTLAPLLDNAQVPLQAMSIQTELLRSEFFRAETDADRSQLRGQLASTLEQAFDQGYSTVDKRALATNVLPLLTASEQLAAYQQLFKQTTGIARFRLGQDIANLQEATGNPNSAKDTLGTIFPLVPTDEENAFIRNLIRLELATGNAGNALKLFQETHEGTSLNPQQLREGIRLADLAGEPEASGSWLALLAQKEPDDIDVQRRFLMLQLGRGDLREALTTIKRMENSGRALASSDRERIAKVYEWNSMPSEALSYWRDLFLSQTPEDTSSIAYDRATSLASGLFRWPTLVELLKVRAARKQLSPEGYNQLTDALISTGDMSNADQYLTQGIARFPENAALRQRRFVLLVNSRRFKDAISMLQAAPSLTDEEKVRLANLHWRTRDPESALTALEFIPESPELAQEAEAMRWDLAIMLNRKDLLKQFYERSAKQPVDGIPEELRDRIITLSWQFGSPDESLALSRQQYRETGELRYLITMAELQNSLNQWDELAESLAQWDSTFSQASNDPRFWVLTARLHQAHNKPEAAQKAFLAAATLAPDNSSLLINWGWFLLSRPSLLPGQLPQILATLADYHSADTYPLQIYGHLALNEPELAEVWLAEARKELSGDPSQLLSLSDYARNNGARSEAEALRQYAVLITGKLEKPDPEVLTQLHSVLRDPIQEPVGPVYRFDNRALQASAQILDLGGFSVHTAGVTGQFSHDRYRWLFSAEHSSAQNQGLLLARPEPTESGRLQWQTNNQNLLLSTELSTYRLASGDKLSAAFELTTQPSDRFTLGAGLAFNERVTNSAEAWWLTSANRASVSGSYAPWPRLELTGEIDYITVDEAFGGEIGTGYNTDLLATYSLLRNDPAWRISLGYQSRQLNLSNSLSAGTLAKLSVPLAPDELLTDDYRRIGLTSQWSHGEPQALNRTAPSPRLFFALDSGYVLSTSSFDFGARMGLGWRIAGDDELAFSAGYSTDSLDGQSRADAKLTYTLYLGH
ncbi:tetratricopeptide repeat protein [Marinobacter sp. S6332]|uniref:tetratricopeptide repeat protein n=1 Tax=Marinobacter sp. S6332 TaxID=2926403 RepID=UPI001FF63E93|nr:tetratricopeptide repeat protein [Marinobacter sp. S6332]MCK0162462.1 tetratricopeptide repeat protein [Marinobacter sp. S6332]